MKKQIILLMAITIFGYQSLKAQQGPEQQGPPKPPSIEDRLKHLDEKLSKELTLTADQKTKLEAAYKDFFVKADKLHDKMPPPPPPPAPGNKAEMDKLSKERDEAIQKVLSADQFKKYAELEKTLRPKPPGNQPPPPSDKKQ